MRAHGFIFSALAAATMIGPAGAAPAKSSAIIAVDVTRDLPAGTYGGLTWRYVEGVIHGEVSAAEPVAGLSELAGGDLNARVPEGRDDEIGRAIQAFNDMAGRLQESTERLVYLRQLASWQTLARKMAHEVKNSLTPIRLTVEEMLARYDDADRGFMSQATQIVVDEIETLEKRIRAFSQFATEPPVEKSPVDVNSILQERISFLKMAHPEVAYDCRLEDEVPHALADQDLLKGILTNLLENAAEAAGQGGHILGVTAAQNGRIAI